MAIENKVLNTRIKLKRDTSANWTNNNPVLLNGEIIIVDTAEGEVRFKIGDGSKTYTQLPFEDEGVRNLIADKSKVIVETWTDSSESTAQFLNELIINKVKDRQTYEEMVDAGKVSINELYFIEEDEQGTVLPNQTQSDWNQNDETKADYIKNRTHYIEKEYETTISPTTETSSIEIEYGDLLNGEHVVIVDGVEYVCDVYFNNNSEPSLGDSRLAIANDMSNPVDVPFCITSGWETPEGSFLWEEVAVAYIYYPDSDPHTIEVRRITGETIKQLDEKYIPDTIARKDDLESAVLITVEDIDTICGGSIQYADDVTF